MQDNLSNLIVYSKYANYLPEQNRRETFDEAVDRTRDMHIRKFPQLKKELTGAFELVKEKKILPSMRSLQFGGLAIERNNCKMYNCAATAIESAQDFAEIMYLLLCGCGVTYSVQNIHISKLRFNHRPYDLSTVIAHTIKDSIEGWSDSIGMLMELGTDKHVDLQFDYSQIRPKGSKISSGGIAPGPEPLMLCHENIRRVLSKKKVGEKLTALECHDICCFIADAVLAGGVRRSACMAIFDKDDDEMLNCKSGDWWKDNPQRARANNSVALPYYETSQEEFYLIMDRIRDSKSGEPGIFWTYDRNILQNPCGEVSLKPRQFCNLVEINMGNNNSDSTDDDSHNKSAQAASFIATVQASYTDFPYLSKEWRLNTEADALIGVSLTGILDSTSPFVPARIASMAQWTLDANRDTALKLGINPAQRTTVIKPSGTAALVLGCSSGIHPRYSEYYIRRVKFGRDEAIAKYLIKNHPFAVENDISDTNGIVVKLPIKSPDGAKTRDMLTASDFFRTILRFTDRWIRYGHRNGKNYNNISCTISYKEDEFDSLKQTAWDERYNYQAISFLPFDGGTYPQAPFTACTAEEYQTLKESIGEFDLTQVKEYEDNTCFDTIVACAGGACDLS